MKPDETKAFKDYLDNGLNSILSTANTVVVGNQPNRDGKLPSSIKIETTIPKVKNEQSRTAELRENSSVVVGAKESVTGVGKAKSGSGKGSKRQA